MRTIGMDLGVTAATELAVADGAHVESTRRVASTPAGLVAALRTAAANGPVNIVLESTAMAWFVANQFRVPVDVRQRARHHVPIGLGIDVGAGTAPVFVLAPGSA